MPKQVLSLHFTKFIVECWILHCQIKNPTDTWEGLLSLRCSVIDILDTNTSLADDFLAKVLYSAYGSKQGLAPNILSLVWMPQQLSYRLKLCFGVFNEFLFRNTSSFRRRLSTCRPGQSRPWCWRSSTQSQTHCVKALTRRKELHPPNPQPSQ